MSMSTSPIITQAFRRSLKNCQVEYTARHMQAWHAPGDATEYALATMLTALARYAAAHKHRYESDILADGVLGPAWADILKGFRTLLNGETGRFDAGALDAAACDLFFSAGGKEEDL